MTQQRLTLLCSNTEHPIGVAKLLAAVGGVTDISTLQAGVLHDTLEDTDTTFQELQSKFGEKVAKIVREVRTLSLALPRTLRTARFQALVSYKSHTGYRRQESAQRRTQETSDLTCSSYVDRGQARKARRQAAQSSIPSDRVSCFMV